MTIVNINMPMSLINFTVTVFFCLRKFKLSIKFILKIYSYVIRYDAQILFYGKNVHINK